MTKHLGVALALAAVFGMAGAVRAEKGTDIKPALAKPGKVVLDEKFDGTVLGKGWTVAKGDWQVSEGAVVGKEKASDKHAAVLGLQQPFKNSVVRFSFLLDGSKALHLSLNHAKGHLYRVVITSEGLSLQMDKDKKDAASKMVVLGRASEEFVPGKWYTLQMETVGDKVVVQTDNGVKLEGTNPGLMKEKTGYRFVTQGETVRLDDLKVWEAE